MVKLLFVEQASSSPSSGPIGVVASLVQGFDRVAARPVLILPPLLLDLFIWLGPRIRITPLIEQLLRGFSLPSGADETIQEQFNTLISGINLAVEEFNLLTTLSTLPAGIPSLMAGVGPDRAPLILFQRIRLRDPLIVVGIWLAITVVGLGLGALYHRSLAGAAAPAADLPSWAWAWSRLVALAAVMYAGLFILVVASLLISSLGALILPILGIGLSFVTFSLVFWLVIYLIFTPHGIIRYRFGLVRAMLESMILVRWNFLATVGFLAAAFGISWLTNNIWALAQDGSWYALLSILGHAFVSGTLLVSSYVFYQGRRDWLMATKEAIEARLRAAEAEMSGITGAEGEGEV